jgi:hypothetical protein
MNLTRLRSGTVPTAKPQVSLIEIRDEGGRLLRKVPSVRGWRKKRCGPRWYRINSRLIRYQVAKVVAWANSQSGGQAA